MRVKTPMACLFVLIGLGWPPSAKAEEVVLLQVMEVMTNQALYYRSGSDVAAVLVHQSGASMESWRPFAEVLLQNDISALALATPTHHDVRSGVEYLHDHGYTEIVLVGASIGGGAILQALRSDDLPGVRKVVLLATSSGPALESNSISKLFLIAKQDFFKAYAYAEYKEASEPKRLLEYEGREHGQALLDGQHAEDVLSEIIQFLKK